MRSYMKLFAAAALALVLLPGVCSAQSAWDHYIKATEYQNSEPDLKNAIAEMQKAVSKDPENAFYRSALGLLYFNVSDCQRAVPELKKAVEMNPEIIDAHTALGACYTINSDFTNAIKEFNTALQYNPPNSADVATIYNNLGQIYSMTGKPSEAEANLLKAMESDPSLVTTYINLGNLYAASDRKDNAADMYKKAIELSPNYSLAHNNLAFIYITQAKYPEALAELDAAVRLEPGNQYYQENRKWVEMMTREPEKFQDGKLKGLPKEITLKPQPPASLAQTAPVQQEPVSQPQQTAPQKEQQPSVAQQQPAEQPVSPPPQKKQPVVENKTETPAQQQPAQPVQEKQPTLAIKQPEVKAAKNTKLMPTPEELAAEYYKAARYNISTGRIPAAKRDIQRALEIYPEKTEFIIAYGIVLLREGAAEDAAAQFGNALALEPANSIALNGSGFAADLQGKSSDADAAYINAVASGQTDGCAAANAAASRVRKADCGEETMNLFSAALENGCSQGALLNNMSLCSMMSGDMDQALRQAKKAVKLSPMDTVIRENYNFVSIKSGVEVEKIKLKEKRTPEYSEIGSELKEISLKNLVPVLTLDFHDVFLANWKTKTILVLPFENPRGVNTWSPSPSEIYTSKVFKVFEDSGYFQPVAPVDGTVYSFDELMKLGMLKKIAKRQKADLIFIGRLNRISMNEETERRMLGLKKKEVVQGTTVMETMILDGETLKPVFQGRLEGNAQLENIRTGEISYHQLKQLRDEVFENYCGNVSTALMDHYNLLRYPVGKDIVSFLSPPPKNTETYHW